MCRITKKTWRVCCIALAILLIIPAIPVAASPRIVYRHAAKGEKKRIALTFDDGPHPKYTPQILDILSEYGIPATFFVVGSNAEAYPKLIKRELQEGHEIGNHTYRHYHSSAVSSQTMLSDIEKGGRVLEEIGGEKPSLFRPPEGVCTSQIKALCEQEGYTIILWTVDTRDWAHTPVNEICRNVRCNTKDGSIILMHDFIGKNSPTPAALRRIIPMLQESGYEFVTVSQLLED